MKNISIKKLSEITNGVLYSKDDTLLINSFSKDTRTIKKGDVYIGIKGENFDGNLFYKDAIDLGASLCILDNKDVDTSYGNILIVSDSKVALKKLAEYERDNFKGKVIAVTGSVGKTSTRTIIATLLSEKYKVLSTKGNYNNDIGLPLTILEHTDEDIMVLEMGMNHFNEIDYLSKIAKPDIAVITNIGTAHIGNLGSRENILKAKIEIINGMNNGTLILNGDNDLLSTVNVNLKTIFCSIEKKLDFYVKNIVRNENQFKIELFNGETYILNNATYPTIMNYLLAICVSKELYLTYDEIRRGLNKVSIENRMSIIKTNRFTIIDDSYNASLEAMKSAIDYLNNLKCTRRLCILGDMLELGNDAKSIHESLNQYLNNIDLVLTTGENAKYINGIHFDNIDLLIDNMYSYLKDNDTILVKASHGMHFNKIVDNLKNN